MAYLGRLVFACGDEICAIRGPLQVGDGVVELVDLHVVELFASLVQVRTGNLDTGIVMRTLASYCDTLPSSCPAQMYLDMKLQPATVALLSSHVIVMDRSLDCSASGSRFTSKTTIVPK